MLVDSSGIDGGTAADAYDRVVADAKPGDRDGNSRGRRVGVMGGTFDPIHHGHLAAAAQAAHVCELDHVIFVPTGVSWQKDSGTVSPAEDRYAMTVLATAARDDFSVSRVDIDRGGSTYTVDTLRDLRRIHPLDEFFFITGADTLASVTTWKAVDEVFSLAEFIAVTRPGYVLEASHLPDHARVRMVEMPALDISATDCRRRVSVGEPIWFLVPDAVARYVTKRRLYR